LPVTIDSPHEVRRPRGGRKLLFLLIGLIVLFFLAKAALSYWVDLLWFGSLGYAQVFWTMLRLNAAVFGVAAVGTFAILYGSFSALRKLHQEFLPGERAILVNGQPVNLPIGPAVRIVSLIVAAIAAIISGSALASDWPTFALFWNTPRGGAVDAIFARPLNFYLFTLPALQLIAGWLLTLAVIISIAAVLLAFLSGSTNAIHRKSFTFGASPWRGVSIAAVPLLLLLAVNTWLSRFELLFDRHTLFTGISYADAHVSIHFLLLTSLALVVGAIVATVNALRRPSTGRMLLIAILPAAICFVVSGVVGWYVTNFVVKPNELVREQPYISNNIQATRAAFGLDRFSQREFPAETTPEAADPANNQATLQNIRLWDWHALQDTLRQVQEIRTYYDFPDIDIDRYQINGPTRQVMIATRELNVDKLPEASRNWINERLIYTHGYGITMNPVNEFTSEGLPNLYLSNMPVQSTVPPLNVTRPQIYYGELTDTDVYVKTRQQEFDYPQGQSNSLTSYGGTGGIPIGSFLRRIAIAFDRDDLGKLPFSDDVSSSSLLLMRRNVRDRVSTLAPFLSFDHDPYMVVGADGRLFWMMDAFTTSDTYPYSTAYSVDGDSLNYMRNSVKTVVDAYNGTTTFYVFDTEDPVIAAWQRIFPTLFKPASEMPTDLHAHIRYPERLFRLQAQVYGLYHMTNPSVFFNREDLWTVATQTTGTGDNQASQAMDPNFVLMKLPGESSDEFVEILPFTPANRNNLIGWIAARCDGEHYGTSIVYNFPKTRLVDGPQQIESRIDQNAQLSSQLTLWNQQGSHVLRGSLLVIPSGKALLYAEPIYLQAQQSPMPELRIVVLALQDRLAYGPTFEAALSSLFGSETPNFAPGPNAPSHAAPATQRTQDAPDTIALIAEASRDFDDYQRLTAQGHLAEAGQKLDALKHALDQLNAIRK
jgi:uncharacterized membrane protein (UPF0182 family)